MPELPEVETVLRGIKPHIEQQTIKKITLRHTQLRWPIPATISKLSGIKILSIQRRAKYLLLQTHLGTFILHLGMSGSVRILQPPFPPPKKHDHVDIEFKNGVLLRFNDPRRFGALLWTEESPEKHFLLSSLGVEPLSKQFTGEYLFALSRGRKTPIKSFIMNSKIVAGVGNIYAAEALFKAGIHPEITAGKIDLAHYKKLVTAIKAILTLAIKTGGTTLKDFINSDGTPGYFSFKLKVYGRGSKPCTRCKTKLIEIRLGQRSTVYCQQCQRIK